MKKFENVNFLGERGLFRAIYLEKKASYIYFLLFLWIQLKNIYILEKLEKNLK